MSSDHPTTTTEPRPPSRGRRLAAALLGATCLVGAGLAYGQTGGFAYDPSQLPETSGTLRQYTLTPRGDVDGLVLEDGTEVKLPPHLSAQIVFAVRPGDRISVRGLKARALPLIAASQVRNAATGATVTDEGGPREWRDRPESIVSGRVALALHGPRGETNGLLLDNGMTVRMPPHEAERWADLIRQGQEVSVRGTVTATLLGQVMEARAIGATPDRLSSLAPPRGPKGDPRRDGPRGPREARGEPWMPPAAGPLPAPPPPGFGPPPPPPGAGPADGPPPPRPPAPDR